MRRPWAAGAVIVVWLLVGGSLALAQQATEGATPAPTPNEAVHVSGSLSDWAGTFEPPGSVAGVVTSDPRLDGCFVAQSVGGSSAGSWGTLKIFDRCGWIWPDESSVLMWEGGWFIADRAPGSISIFGEGLGAVWLDGCAENEGWSASLWIEEGILDAWLFPTPVTTTVPMPGQDGE